MMNGALIEKVEYLVGSYEIACNMSEIPSLIPFNEIVCAFLFDLSEKLMKNPDVRSFPDMTTYAFWIRKASVKKMKGDFSEDFSGYLLGKGLVFHIAPSNVPMNFAYSLTVGLLMGNANIVRVPSKNFQQIEIFCREIEAVLEKHADIRPYVCLVRYGHEKDVNDYFSSMCDERVVWGGDNTISELRKSPLPSRSHEIAFADRYSLAVIDADYYIESDDKRRIAMDFYNDTYLTDQNACTSPKIVIWVGKQLEVAKNFFWNNLFEIVEQKYPFNPIQAVDKLDMSCKAAVEMSDTEIERGYDNRLVRIKIQELCEKLMDYTCHSGFFYEYDCKDIMEISVLCNNKRCQTISYIGNKDMFETLVKSGVKGVDRIVPIGKTMDFDLIWDGYDLRRHLTRIVSVG